MCPHYFAVPYVVACVDISRTVLLEPFNFKLNFEKIMSLHNFLEGFILKNFVKSCEKVMCIDNF